MEYQNKRSTIGPDVLLIAFVIFVITILVMVPPLIIPAAIIGLLLHRRARQVRRNDTWHTAADIRATRRGMR